MAAWRTVRVFVSSIFSHMQADMSCQAKAPFMELRGGLRGSTH